MLTEKQFQQWCLRLGLSAETRDLIARLRTSPPARRVSSRAHNVSGAYASRKMGYTIQFESHKVELWAIYDMEYDRAVLEYYDQPMVLELRYTSPSGRPVHVKHTPDFLVLHTDRAVLEEWKPEDRLRELSVSQPQRYQHDDQGRWRCPPGEEAASRLGLRYRVRSSAELSATYIRNLIFLEDYFFACVVPPSHLAALLGVACTSPGIRLSQLLQDGALGSHDSVYALIARNQLYADLKAAPLVEPEHVFVYPDQPTAEAQALLKTSRLRATDRDKGERWMSPLPPTTGTQVLWDGKLWQIVNLGQTMATLRSEEGSLTDLSREYFLHQIDLGMITIPRPPPTDEVSRLHPEAQWLLREASPEALAVANQRWYLVCAYLEQRHEEVKGYSPRTLRAWAASFREAENKYQCGYVGLLPKTAKRGNRKKRTSQESRDLLDTFLAEQFETPTQPPARAIYRAYHRECVVRGLPVLSERTFYRQIKSRRGTVQTTKRKGTRAAYAQMPWYWVLTQTTPRHGDRPWEIVHLDHTKLDLELVSPLGSPLGRPWVTFATDAYSRRLLGLSLSFDPPSYRACMMALRACVRRYERFPQSIIVDGGPEFQSVYFERLLARYYCTKKTRPGSEPRFGSVIERLFGTTNTEFIHTLRGNTQASKEARTMTLAVDPKGLAVWPLPDLYEYLCTYAYQVYDQKVHEALGQSPRDAYLLGLERFGDRSHRRVPYNEEFVMETLPSPRKQTALVVPGKGVKLHYLYYWNDALRHPEVERMQVPIRYDPFDIGTAYVYCRGQWIQCLSQYYQQLHGHSEKELELATEELREQARRNHRAASITPLHLAEFLLEVQAHQRVLLQRVRDLEHGAVLRALDAGVEGKKQAPVPPVEDSTHGFPAVDLETVPAFEEYRL
jgi:putative transposase